MSTPKSIGSILGGGGGGIPDWIEGEERASAQAALDAGKPWWWLPHEVVERLDREQAEQDRLDVAKLNASLGYNPRTRCCENFQGKRNADAAASFLNVYAEMVRELKPLHNAGDISTNAFMRRAAAIVGEHLHQSDKSSIASIADLIDSRGGVAVRDAVADFLRQRAAGQVFTSPIGILRHRLDKAAGMAATR